VDVFYAADRSTVQRSAAIFMHQLEKFPYSSTAVPNYQIVQLAFTDTLSMILAVPIVKNAPLTNASAVLAALPELETQQRVALALPKFQFEREYLNDLQAALVSAGVSLPFDAGHLCVYENDCSPALEIVIQKTFISVDEKGVRNGQ
jgi:serine protease inhibitor